MRSIGRYPGERLRRCHPFGLQFGASRIGCCRFSGPRVAKSPVDELRRAGNDPLSYG